MDAGPRCTFPRFLHLVLLPPLSTSTRTTIAIAMSSSAEAAAATARPPPPPADVAQSATALFEQHLKILGGSYLAFFQERYVFAPSLAASCL